MGLFDHPQHSVIVHPEQMEPSEMEALAQAARDRGFDPIVNDLGFYLGGLTGQQAQRLTDGLRRMGIDPLGAVSYDVAT